jgi:choline dehydrogenase-like flavoprotein
VILDARTLPNDQTIESDLCIIGAGPAGITLAREFSAQRLRVCLLESGGLELDEATQSLYQGVSVGQGRLPLDATRLRYFGGTSNHWGGWCGMLSPIDFEERPWISHSGWPFGLPELLPFYARARPICEVDPVDYDPARWEDIAGAPRLPLGVDILPTAMVQLSPPTRFGEKYRQELQDAQNIAVYLNANVLEIETNEQGAYVSSLRLATLQGKSLKARAKAYVLATGGIENPRMLLLSNAVQKTGLGNSHDLVGRFFMGHPTCHCATLAPHDPYLDLRLYDQFAEKARAVLALSEQVQRRETLPNAFCVLRPGYYDPEGVKSIKALLGIGGANAASEDLMGHITNIVRDFDEVGSLAYRKVFGGSTKRIQSVAVNIGWEQTPSVASRVRLAAARDRFNQQQVELNWVVAAPDKEFVRRVAELLAGQVGNAGIGRVQVLLDDDVVEHVTADDAPVARVGRGWSDEMTAAVHPMGTTRMHADPKRGVVDPDCRVHGIENLFVAGSSVFPTSGYINPTLTIVALSLRLADHLKATMT